MLVLVPTRGRPDNALRLLQRFMQFDHDDTEIMFIADEDDPALADYQALVPTHLDVTPRLRLGGTLNRYALEFAPRYDIIGFMGDDVMPRTHDWAKIIRTKMIDNGVVYPNDCVHGEDLPTAVFMDSNLILSLEYMVLPGLTHLFIDNYWYALGEALGTRVYLRHVTLEHLHPLVGKASSDGTYEEASAHWSADEELFRKHVESGELASEVARVLAR